MANASSSTQVVQSGASVRLQRPRILRGCRIIQGYDSQADFARHVKVSRFVAWCWENGRGWPSPAEMQRVRAALPVFAYLVDRLGSE